MIIIIPLCYTHLATLPQTVTSMLVLVHNITKDCLYGIVPI